eukprot:m.82413 g.82413  ORF g.82413 m.82413 type:complete len:65 (+) comp50776_c0_seq9:95-289(+)
MLIHLASLFIFRQNTKRSFKPSQLAKRLYYLPEATLAHFVEAFSVPTGEDEESYVFNSRSRLVV